MDNRDKRRTQNSKDGAALKKFNEKYKVAITQYKQAEIEYKEAKKAYEDAVKNLPPNHLSITEIKKQLDTKETKYEILELNILNLLELEHWIAPSHLLGGETEYVLETFFEILNPLIKEILKTFLEENRINKIKNGLLEIKENNQTETISDSLIKQHQKTSERFFKFYQLVLANNLNNDNKVSNLDLQKYAELLKNNISSAWFKLAVDFFRRYFIPLAYDLPVTLEIKFEVQRFTKGIVKEVDQLSLRGPIYPKEFKRELLYCKAKKMKRDNKLSEAVINNDEGLDLRKNKKIVNKNLKKIYNMFEQKNNKDELKRDLDIGIEFPGSKPGSAYYWFITRKILNFSPRTCLLLSKYLESYVRSYLSNATIEKLNESFERMREHVKITPQKKMFSTFLKNENKENGANKDIAEFKKLLKELDIPLLPEDLIYIVSLIGYQNLCSVELRPFIKEHLPEIYKEEQKHSNDVSHSKNMQESSNGDSHDKKLHRSNTSGNLHQTPNSNRSEAQTQESNVSSPLVRTFQNIGSVDKSFETFINSKDNRETPANLIQFRDSLILAGFSKKTTQEIIVKVCKSFVNLKGVTVKELLGFTPEDLIYILAPLGPQNLFHADIRAYIKKYLHQIYEEEQKDLNGDSQSQKLQESKSSSNLHETQNTHHSETHTATQESSAFSPLIRNFKNIPRVDESFENLQKYREDKNKDKETNETTLSNLIIDCANSLFSIGFLNRTATKKIIFQVCKFSFESKDVTQEIIDKALPSTDSEINEALPAHNNGAISVRRFRMDKDDDRDDDRQVSTSYNNENEQNEINKSDELTFKNFIIKHQLTNAKEPENISTCNLYISEYWLNPPQKEHKNFKPYRILRPLIREVILKSKAIANSEKASQEMTDEKKAEPNKMADPFAGILEQVKDRFNRYYSPNNEDPKIRYISELLKSSNTPTNSVAISLAWFVIDNYFYFRGRCKQNTDSNQVVEIHSGRLKNAISKEITPHQRDTINHSLSQFVTNYIDEKLFYGKIDEPKERLLEKLKKIEKLYNDMMHAYKENQHVKDFGKTWKALGVEISDKEYKYEISQSWFEKSLNPIIAGRLKNPINANDISSAIKNIYTVNSLVEELITKKISKNTNTATDLKNLDIALNQICSKEEAGDIIDYFRKLLNTSPVRRDTNTNQFFLPSPGRPRSATAKSSASPTANPKSPSQALSPEEEEFLLSVSIPFAADYDKSGKLVIDPEKVATYARTIRK